jgi:LacI family transcriptional regulator
MTHRFPIKEIARHAGISTATVDRVINNRAHVSPQTKTRVARAISELERQEQQIATQGRQMFFDFVIDAPARFSHEVKAAAEAVMDQFGMAVCRPRFLTQEIMPAADVVQALDRIIKRGSQGVCIKARDIPEIRAAVDRVVTAGIPVVTLVTDIQDTARTAYVGLDNASAGRTAAYLISQSLGHDKGTVLTTRSNAKFLGEEERETAFALALRGWCPHLQTVSTSSGGGVHYETTKDLGGFMDQLGDLRAVYSMGGGNRTILDMLDHHRLVPQVFVAHDLDQDNRSLIAEGRINFVLHHDLQTDMQRVFGAFLQHQSHGVIEVETLVSPVQVITPQNVPDQRMTGLI